MGNLSSIRNRLRNLSRKAESAGRKFVVDKLHYYSRPSFVIIGAQKAGTSALFRYLAQHPRLLAPTVKEIGYFSDDTAYKVDDHKKYHRHFPIPHVGRRNATTFEASPFYLFHPLVASRIKAYNPEMKLVVMLREPAERAYSAWNMYRSFVGSKRYGQWADIRSFNEVVNEELASIQIRNYQTDPRALVKRGIYIDQVNLYLKHFERKSIHFIENTELKTNTAACLNQLCDFLSIPSFDFTLLDKKSINKGEYGEIIPADTLEMLKTFYKPHNKRLFKITGRYDW